MTIMLSLKSGLRAKSKRRMFFGVFALEAVDFFTIFYKESEFFLRFLRSFISVIGGAGVLLAFAACSGSGAGGNSTLSFPVQTESVQPAAKLSVDTVATLDYKNAHNGALPSIERPGQHHSFNPDHSGGYHPFPIFAPLRDRCWNHWFDHASRGDSDADRDHRCKPSPSPSPTALPTLTPAVVVSDDTTNDVYVFNNSGVLQSTITGFNVPQGIAGDAHGNIYVANLGSNDVLEYKSDYATLVATLADVNQFPGDTAISATGVVAVMNLGSNLSLHPSIEFYPSGVTTPTVSISDPNWSAMYFGAFDKSGNLYFDGKDLNGNMVVGEVVNGISGTAITTLTVANTLVFPGGVQVTPSGSIVVGDQAAQVVYTYAAPVAVSLGSPVSTTTLTNSFFPSDFSLNSNGSTLWTSDAGVRVSQQYAYPAGGSAVSSVSGGVLQDPVGVLKVGL
jgi:hypothetical protein